MRARYLLYPLSLLPFAYVTVRLFLSGPPVWPDEAIITDAALTLIKTGHIATGIFHGAIPGVESHFYFYPPFYFILLARWIRLFGASIESVRFLSVTIACATLIVFGLLVRRVYRSDILAAIGIVLLGIDQSFGVASRTARMDSMVFFLLVLMVLLMVVAVEKKLLGWFMGAGVVAALAVMTHPLGLMVPAVGIIFIFAYRGSWLDTGNRIIAVISPPLFATAVWILSMGKSFSSFIYQYQLQFLLKQQQEADLITQLRDNMLWRMFIGIVIVTLIVRFVTLARVHRRTDMVWLGAFILFVLVMVVGKEFWFTLYIQPFYTLILLSLLALLPEYHRMARIGIVALVAASIIVTALLTRESSSSFLRFSKPYHEMTAEVSPLIPDGSHILLVAIPDPYFDLRMNTSVTLSELPPTSTTNEALRRLLDDTDVILLTRTPGGFFRSYVDNNTKSIVAAQSGSPARILVVTLVAREDRR